MTQILVKNCNAIFIKTEHATNVLWAMGSLSFSIYIPKTVDVHNTPDMWSVTSIMQFSKAARFGKMWNDEVTSAY